MIIFLSIIILLLSQTAFCSENQFLQHYSRRGFEDLSIEVVLRGHPNLEKWPLNQTPQFPTKEQIELATQEKRTSTLKGSTEKVDKK